MASRFIAIKYHEDNINEAQAAFTRAQTAQMYVDMGALDPTEVRKGLTADKAFEIETLLDDIPESDLTTGWEDEYINEGDI
jgi:hypothetical protein